MPRARTSESDPLRIAEVAAGPNQGRVGITLCPGKVDAAAMSGAWDRDLDLDMREIARWGASAVVTLITNREMELLRVERLGDAAAAHRMEWWHLPIEDVNPPGPDFEEAWQRRAGPALRDRLRLGFDVLVHCRGGLGRAGTVAARLLAELGVAPQEAIQRVRAARPGAIETSAQEAHAARRTPRPPIGPPRTRDSIEDRALGAFVGLAVGDALGTTLEFAARDSKPRLRDMCGGGPFDLRAGEWTDDTAMALALAESLVACDGFDAADLMDRFVGWWRNGDYSCTGHCFDIGVTTRHALGRYEMRDNPFAGSTDERTAGNGSLMRLSPVAVRYWNDAGRAAALAVDQSRTTHAARAAVDGCRVFVELLSEAIAGVPAATVLAPRTFDGSPEVAQIMAGSWRGKSRDRISSSGYVVHTLEAALWCAARTSSFEGAVLLAANLGDDADTVAAVTGQLAGSLYGLSGIPERWLSALAWRDRLHEIGSTLVHRSFR